jgi:hypothetical protein
MPISARRFIYSLLTALGFVMMVPFVVGMRRLQAELAAADPTNLEAWLQPAVSPWTEGTIFPFLLGLVLASSFLYLALTTGSPKAWRPEENGTPRCSRCGSDVRFGVNRCPSCEQQLVW